MRNRGVEDMTLLCCELAGKGKQRLALRVTAII